MRYTECNQIVQGLGCGEPPRYRFTWPGDDEKGICENHSKDIRGIADALGLHLQLIPLDEEGK